MNNNEIYASITERIIENLQTKGSWKKMWQVPSPVSLNGRYYNGINRLILAFDKYSSPVWGTYKQIRENGGQVNKGEKSTIVIFWKIGRSIDQETQKEKRSFLLRNYNVFNTDQATFDDQGKQHVEKLALGVKERTFSQSVQADAIIEGYTDKPTITHTGTDDRAYYSPMLDMIHMPDRKYFFTDDAYYKVLFHEMGHSTGHSSRLNRDLSGGMSSHAYSKEELVAELCSAYLSNIAGIDEDIKQSAIYIQGWSSKLRDNVSWISWAASRAEAAAEHILGNRKEEKQEEPAEVEVEA